MHCYDRYNLVVFIDSSDIINYMKTPIIPTKSKPLKHIFLMTKEEQEQQNYTRKYIDPNDFHNVCTFFEKRGGKDIEDAIDETKDYFYYKQMFEDKCFAERRMQLRPSFRKAIERYIYNFEKAPPNIDMWTAPIRILKESGLLKHLLKT